MSDRVRAAWISDRVRAGWIDVVVVALIGAGISLASGDGHVGRWTTYEGGVSTHHAGAAFALPGGLAVVWVVAALVYYSALEAWTGQTIGKALTGVRVVDLDGRPPSGRAIVLRTAGRIIDVLPLFYFVGWFVKPGRDRVSGSGTGLPARPSPASSRWGRRVTD